MYDENSNASSAAVSTATTAQLSAATAQPSNALMSQILNVKDSRWLQVEVCREFQRGQCARSDQECKFAHPPPHVDVQQGRVTACYDSIKGRCTRENPKCKYLHPPQHIKDQLLINGRNNLALKNLLCSQLNQSAGQPITTTVNPMAQLIAQQQQSALAASMVPTLPYPYYQGGLVYSPLLGDPYQQQMQTAGLMPGHAAGLQGLTGLSMAHAQATHLLQSAPGLSHPLMSGSRKRTLEEEPSDHSTPHPIYNFAVAAAAAAAGVPCKRPAMEKTANGAVLFNPQAQPNQQQFNPYLLQGLQGYVPAVSFNGQAGGMPPRY